MRWSRSSHMRGPQAVAVAAGYVVAHERGTRLVGLDAATGEVRWDVPLGTWPRAVVVAGERCWALPQDRDEVDCLDLRTGALVWRAPVPPYTGHLVVAGDTVLVGGWRGYTALRALHRETGTLRWAAAARMATVRPVAAGGVVLVSAPGASELRMLDSDGGAEVRRLALPEPLADSDDRPALVAVDDDHVLFRCGPRTIRRVHAGSGDGEEFFRAAADLTPDAPSVTGTLAWVRDSRGGLTAVDLTTGGVRRRVGPGDPPAAGVAPAGDCHLVARQSGILLRVDDDGVHERVTALRRIDSLHALDPDTVLLAGAGGLRAVSPH
ncbi:PQQ-binding-like beta-propeller repeat protein [Micromonospora sp. b486]|nr:PQQ-binding-like beta-propeller repeat protein [Micromonospora sp. b486]MDM4780391.1 PQQ-binding-like beta-propeller repeat protein [Micromonospora sp. b486]